MAEGEGREVEILRRAASTTADLDEVRRLITAGVDWSVLLEAARLHGLTPLLWWTLSRAGPDVVAPEQAAYLRDQFHRNAAHGLLMQHEVIRILELLQDKGIRGVPYKGPVLASTAYGNVALRTYSDLDIVVRPRDVERALALLLDDAYRVVHTDDERARDEHHRFHHELRRRDERVKVELHWSFAPRSWRFMRDLAPVWGRLEPWDVGGGEVVQGLSPEDLLIVLCAHGARHWWLRLLWVADIAELVRARPDMDWDAVLDRARRDGVRRLTLSGLALAEEVLGAPLPEAVLAAFRDDPVVRSVSARLREMVLMPRPAEPSGRPASKLYLAMRERRRDKLAYLLYPNEEDLSSVSLPAGMSGLYWAVRPVKLAAKYVVEPSTRLACRALGSSPPDVSNSDRQS